MSDGDRDWFEEAIDDDSDADEGGEADADREDVRPEDERLDDDPESTAEGDADADDADTDTGDVDAADDADPADDADESDDDEADGDDDVTAGDEIGVEDDNEPDGGDPDATDGGDDRGESDVDDGDHTDEPDGGQDESDAGDADSGAGAVPTGATDEPTGGGMVDPEGTFSPDDDSLFDDDFASALQGADAPNGEFGAVGGTPDPADEAFEMGTDFGNLGEAGAEGFDDEVDSESSRIELGIEGLDEMIAGGVPERSLMVAIGSAGTGKTTLGVQFLAHGLQNDEKAVYITLEETRTRVIRSATEKGFPFDEYAEEGQLAVVDIDPIEMANSLQTIRSELPRLIDEFGADRLVLDSVSLLEMMYEDRATRRNEIYDFTRSLKDAGVTTMMTSEASEDNPYSSRHGIVEYLTDAVFVLQYVRPSDFRETRLAIEIQKIRDANHSRETKPYDITDEGIDVYRQANIF